MNTFVHPSLAPWLRGFFAVGVVLSVSACGEFEASSSGNEASVSQPLTTRPRRDHAKQAVPPIDSLVYNPAGKLLATDGSAGDALGYSVAISGNFAFVGAAEDDINGPYSGSVVIFERSGGVYTQIQRLVPSDGAAESLFGGDVAASGDTLVVGANGHSTQFPYSGAAYVFVRNGSIWTEQAKLIASDEKPEAAFGWKVEVAGDTALVTAIQDDASGLYSGAAYVFSRNAGVWTEQQKLVPGDGAAQDEFGDALALDGDTALIGAPYDDDNASNTGSVYVFDRVNGTFVQTQKLHASDAMAIDRFGFDEGIKLSGTTAAIGAVGVDVGLNTIHGAMYVFERVGGTFQQTQKLLTNEEDTVKNVGRNIALQQDTLVAGVPITDIGSNLIQGAMFVFARNNGLFEERQKIVAGDGAAGDRFGFSIAMSADTLLAGAVRDDDVANDSGSAYVFVVPAFPCTTNVQCSTGFCVDGVCCDSACGGGNVDDCMACSVFAGTSTDGTCGPRVVGTVCRPATSGFGCDAPEMCDGSSAACPPDAPAVAGVECRPAVGFCDIGEQCDGLNKACPMDTKLPAGTECRAAAGPCDIPEVCDGALGYCPADVKFDSNTVCRPQADACDIADTCDGDHDTCPPDEFVPTGVVCRPISGDCDVAESCTGLSALCPPDAVVANLPCRLSTNNCDAVEECNGVDHECPPDEKTPAGTICRLSDTPCDVTEMCDGVSDACPPDKKVSAGTECRPAAGSCDASEACDGSSNACPPDVKVLLGTTCREVAGACDIAEQCDGTSNDCPADEGAANGAPCAGGICSNGVCSMATSGAGSGGGSVTVPEDNGTCECRMPGAPKSGNGWGWVAMLGAYVVARVRRRG